VVVGVPELEERTSDDAVGRHLQQLAQVAVRVGGHPVAIDAPHADVQPLEDVGVEASRCEPCLGRDAAVCHSSAV
jgi:hypothetical protein